MIKWLNKVAENLRLRILRQVLLDEMVKTGVMDLVFEVKDTKPKYTFEIHIRRLEPEDGDQSQRHPDTIKVLEDESIEELQKTIKRYEDSFKRIAIANNLTPLVLIACAKPEENYAEALASYIEMKEKSNEQKTIS